MDRIETLYGYQANDSIRSICYFMYFHFIASFFLCSSSLTLLRIFYFAPSICLEKKKDEEIYWRFSQMVSTFGTLEWHLECVVEFSSIWIQYKCHSIESIVECNHRGGKFKKYISVCCLKFYSLHPQFTIHIRIRYVTMNTNSPSNKCLYLLCAYPRSVLFCFPSSAFVLLFVRRSFFFSSVGRRVVVVFL